MNFPFIKGQRLIIELKNNQIFEGDLLKATKERIDVANVREYPEGTELNDSFLSFYQIEIISVSVLDELPCAESPKNIITLPRAEYERLRKLSKQYMYLPVMDIHYLSAVNELNNSETIGIVGLWAKYGRMRRLTSLVLSTWEQVYIFDLKYYHTTTFPPELQNILESEEQQKVVHDSARLFDCLWHCHKLKMKNFFDTQVADLQIEKDLAGHVPETTRDLSECLAHYFNFPSSFLKRALDVDVDKWEQRPLSNLQKLKASQLATYLITLKTKQEKIMLKDCFDAMEAYSKSGANV